MSQWKKIASFAALSATMALTATGCLSQSGEDTTDETEIAAVAEPEQAAPVTTSTQAEEKTGEADQAWFGSPFFHHRFFGGFPFFGGFGGFGFPFFGGFGGCGLGGFGGCGLGLGGFGFGGFGGCGGFPFWGGFGGCGC